MMADKYTEEMQERIKKLPERLRNYIAKLEKDVAHYRKLLTETEAGRTRVSWTDYSNKKHLPDNGYVTYHFPNGTLEVSLKDDKIEVRKSGGFNTALVILPAYSNSFYAAILGPGEESAADNDQN